jgi:hypothetical protein
MEAYLEVLLEFVFSTKPPNFGVEAHMEALVGVALSSAKGKTDPRPMWENMNRIGSDGVDVVPVGEVGLRKRRPRPPTLKTFGVHTVSVSREDPSLQEH